jgi:hypothetical protein
MLKMGNRNVAYTLPPPDTVKIRIASGVFFTQRSTMADPTTAFLIIWPHHTSFPAAEKKRGNFVGAQYQPALERNLLQSFA